MRKSILPAAILIFVAAIFSFGQSNSWNKLTPLFSTRADVEKLLGKPNTESVFGSNYQKAADRISVSYSVGECKEGWNVQTDTVLSISIHSPTEIGKSFKELNLNKDNFNLSTDDTLSGTWTNAVEGVQYQFSNIDDELESITYLPKKSDNNLRCDGFPPFSPEAQYYLFSRFGFHPSIKKKDNWLRYSERLDSFIVELRDAETLHKGYVLIYFDNKTSIKENKAFVDRVEKYIFKYRKVSTEKMFVIEGGIREEAEAELYLLPKEYIPPAPNPTLSSPQFKKKD